MQHASDTHVVPLVVVRVPAKELAVGICGRVRRHGNTIVASDTFSAWEHREELAVGISGGVSRLGYRQQCTQTANITKP